MLTGDSMDRGFDWVTEEGTDACQLEVADRSVDLRRAEDVADTAGWDVLGVAKAVARNCRVDRAGRVAGGVRT